MQQMTTVSNEAALNTAIAQIDAGLNFDGSTAATGTAYTITLSSSFTLSSDIMALALVKGATLTIAGSNSTINGGYTGAAGSGYRGFLVYQGDVTIQNVTIQNTVARGGAGGSFFAADAGGGGAGLGGGLLVASGGVVSLSGVNFSADAAIGGAGGNGGAHGNTGYSGGGGLGGAGGYGTLRGAGGGGGVGQAATGGSPSAQSKPINGGIGILPGGSGGNGVYYGGPASGTGGTYSGGGGFGGGSNGLATKGGGGGGGGLGGNPGSLSNAGTGGAGGWGGGGGGGYEHGGNGGFGGGGGSGYFGGNGGFGGGGGGGGYTGYGGGGGGLGGFGGGKGGGGNSSSGAGGGGLGAGGGVFVEQGGTLIIEAGTLSGGSAVGGAGGANVTTPSVSPGTAGLGFGSGIFIQGNQTVTFSPLSGTTLTINDVIADQTGSGGTGAGNTGAGAISVLGGGTTTLDATNTFTGGVTIAGSSTLDLKANGAAGKSTGIIQFGAGTGDTLRIEAAALPGNSFANLIAGFDGTDTIDLTGLNFVLGSTTAMISGGILTATNGTTTNTLKLGGIADGTHFFANPDATGGTELTICYCAGTSILTAHGEVAVENLAAGDMLVTLSGEAQTLRTLQQVRWIGRRRINLDAHPRPETAAPIRIRRGAFAQNVPHRDLLVSPDHAVLEDGKLICARQLINGTTIRQELGMSVVDYFHVELDTHSILLAEGLPAESYLDTGNRGFFTGSTEPLVLHPDLTDETDCPTREAASCAPFVWDEESVRPVWERLAERAVALGLTPPPVHTTSDSQVCVSANGQTLRPIFVGDGLYLFLLPSGTNEVRLISRASAPTDVQPWLEDRRRLGVYVERIVVRGGDDVHETPVDHPGLTEGWWAAEGSGMTLRRWTNGSAVLPLPSMDGPAVLEIRASNGGMPYLVDGDRQHRAA